MGLSGAKVDYAGAGGSPGEIQEIYTRHAARKVFLLSALVLFLVAVALLATVVGAASISIGDVFRVIASRVAPFYQGSASTLAETVVLQLRLPRILLALITGISLAGAGAVMQGILRNSLVSPYTLGMSGGASFFIYLLLKKRKRWWS